MSYNLTESQKDLVRWLVQEVRAERLSDEFWVYWVSERGGFIGEYEGGDKHHSLTQGALDALTISGLIHSERHFESHGESSRRCVLLGKAFEAIDSNFGARDMSTVKEPSPRVDVEYRRTARAHSKTVKLFYSYSHKDERYRERLETHLSLLKREGLLEEWHDRKIIPGQNWKEVLDENLETSDVVVLLVSPDFLASDYCYEREMKRALERHDKGESKVIPVIVRPCDWEWAPFSKLQALPKDAKAITEWSNRDKGWLSVTAGIRKAIEELTAKLSSNDSSPVEESKVPPTDPNERHGNDLTLSTSKMASVPPDVSPDPAFIEGEGMDDVRYHAQLILRALDRAAGGRVGEHVNLHAAVNDDGTKNHGRDYNEAVEYLIAEDAIEEDSRTKSIVSGDHPGGNLYWAMTRRGKALYRELS